MNLIFDAPINNLSFGNVAINLLRELYKKKAKLSIFPKTENDFTAFDKADEDFKSWVTNATTYKYHNLNPDLPSLHLWHLNGSEKRISRRQYLLTFYELDSPTFVEKKLVEMQDKVFLSNPEGVEAFHKLGCKNVKFIPMGFDPDFHVIKSDKKKRKKEKHFDL